MDDDDPDPTQISTDETRRPFADADLERTDDMAVFVDRLNSAYYPARVTALRPGTTPFSEITAVQMTHVTVGIARPGADVDVDPGALGSYHVNVPLSGRVTSQCGKQSIVATPTQAAVFTPEASTRLSRWEAGAAQLCIKIRRQTLEREAARLLGRPLERQIDFDLGLDLRGQQGASWLATLNLLMSELRRPQGLAGTSPIYREQLEMLLVSGLVLGQHSSLSERMHASGPPLRPRTITRVLELIEDDPSRPLTLGGLAEHAGVSARRLQQSFGEHVGTTPMTYVRDVRLRRARRDLLDTDDPVGRIALRWGFSNAGRFASAYREMYGHAPSDARHR
ncbi:MAG: AraC family transcriptional regulator [Solirubrobacteraceae bacterium]